MVLRKDKKRCKSALQAKLAYVSEPNCSVILQGYVCEGENVCVCFLGVNVESSETERIVDCCRHFPWQNRVKKPRECVRRFLEYMGEEPTGTECSGRAAALLINVGNAVSLSGNGVNFYLIQTSLGRGHMEEIAIPFEGKMEPGAMILMADTQWLAGAEGRMADTKWLAGAKGRMADTQWPAGAEDRIADLERILYIEGERTEERMEARLQEAHSNIGGAVLFALEVAANEE